MAIDTRTREKTDARVGGAPLSPPKPRPTGLPKKLGEIRREWSAYVFLAPGLVVFSLFTVFALIYAFYLTFHDWNILQFDKEYIGLDNYSELLADEGFHKAVLNTFYFCAGQVPLSMAGGLGLALVLNQAIRARGVFRALFFLPQVTPFVVVAIIWKWLYNADFGLFNYYLLEAHLIKEPLLWLSSEELAMPSVIMMSVWSGVGFSMVIYLAGLQAVPQELHEAAKVDGAGSFSRLWNVTLPQLAPTTLFLLVMGIIGSLQIVTQIFIMTRGGPVERTTTMVYFIYDAAFKYFDMGYASTMAMALFVITLGFTAVQLWLFRKGAQ
jgi:multiple sugar transport system permease protein